MFGWIQQQMIEDLIVHHEPIDLGFAWLIAVPYRPNWKDALAHDVDYNLDTIKESRAATFRRLTSLTLSGVQAVGKSKQSPDESLWGFHWTLEIIPKALWNRIAAEAELQTREQGGAPHLLNWANIVWSLRARLQQALEEHAHACKLPVGTVNKGRAAKDQELTPFKSSELLKRNSPDSPEPIVWGDGSPPIFTPEGEVLPTNLVKPQNHEPANVLDIPKPRTKGLIEVKPVDPDALTGFPSGDAPRSKAVPKVETPAVSLDDPVPPPQSGGPEAIMDDSDPYPWADDAPEAAGEQLPGQGP
jgi:hypothetical protein